MSITQLSTEILQKIYEYATIKDVIHLSQTSKKNHNAYLGRQLPILKKALYNSPYSPYPELLKLVVSGEPDNIRKPLSTELRSGIALDRVLRSRHLPPLTIPLIQKMAQYAKIADRWTEIYPRLCWRYNSSSRRVLHAHEAERLRKAIYQLWTYSNLFHTHSFSQYAPDPPKLGPHHRDDLRFRLARTWTTIDIVRQSEFVDKIRQLLAIDIYPSNSMVQFQYSQTLSPKTLAKIAWGDDQEHMYLLQALLKFSPADILHLYLDTSTKAERAEFLIEKGRWFLMTPSSWDDAVERMARDERSAWGQPHPEFLSASVTSYTTQLKDRKAEFGITDVEGCERGWSWSADASATGEYVDEWLRPRFGRRVWSGEDEDGSESEDDGSDEDEEA